MSVKRSRIGSSSGFGGTGVLSYASRPAESTDRPWERRSAPIDSAKVLKVRVHENAEEPRPRILTPSSPVQECGDASDSALVGGFLDKCYYCSEKIRADGEVFMYSYLRAFCTAECRDRQIAMDNAGEMDSKKSKGRWSQI